MSSYKATITILFNNLKNLEKFCFYLNSQDPSNTSIWPLFDRKLTSNVFSYTNRGHFLKMSFSVTGYQNSSSKFSVFSDFYSVRIIGRNLIKVVRSNLVKPHNQGPPNCEQQFISKITNSANSSYYANNEHCEKFVLCEEWEQRTVRRVQIGRRVRTTNSANSSFFEIVEHGEQCEQVRTMFGGPCP